MRIVAFAYCRESLAAARRDEVNLAIQIRECSKWQVICVDPEHLRDKDWRVIAASPIFRASYLFTVIDEAHLISISTVIIPSSILVFAVIFITPTPTSLSLDSGYLISILIRILVFDLVFCFIHRGALWWYYGPRILFFSFSILIVVLTLLFLILLYALIIPPSLRFTLIIPIFNSGLVLLP
ncbi:hypothetical protein B0H14DRAFT_3693075 [Mycena olivaceomarginata]|nr:hypothetical protein B0H14DRAFT_3693075 [Mycena olivaceomarginata]